MKIIAELESHDGVIDFLPLHPVNILPRSELLVLAVIWHPSAGDDCSKIELLANLLPGIVKPPSETQTLILRIDTDLDPVEDVTLGIMGGKGEPACDLVVSVAVSILSVIDNQSKGEGHYFSVIFHPDLSFRKAIEKL